MRIKTTFSSVADLMEADESGKLSNADFDDDLWLHICKLGVETPANLDRFDKAVLVYYASRLLEWEVGNGGFAQAAYNIPDWFASAAWAYRQLGLEQAASLIDRAELLLNQGEARGQKFDAVEIGDLFQQFAESELAELDDLLDSAGWWAEDRRLAYVRVNREAFKAIA